MAKVGRGVPTALDHAGSFGIGAAGTLRPIFTGNKEQILSFFV
jgi:hypothetical protein